MKLIWHLDHAAPLIGWLRKLTPKTPASALGHPDGGTPAFESKAPILVAAMTDADTLMGDLCELARAYAAETGQIRPKAVFRQQMDDHGRVIGLRANLPAKEAARDTQEVASWLREQAWQVVRQGLDKQITIFQDTIRETRAHWPMAPRPPRRASPRPCPECGRWAVGIVWPDMGQEPEIRCWSCGWKPELTNQDTKDEETK
jgi:hypothetical protein